MIITIGSISIIAIVYYYWNKSKPEDFPAVDPAHPVYHQAQERANLMQRTYAVTYNSKSGIYHIKESKNVWPSNEDYVVAIVNPKGEKKQLKLVYSK